MLNLIAQADGAGTASGSLAFFSFVTTHWQFCLLHFLEFAIWGAWIVVLGNLLNARGFSRKEIGSIYACMPIGSMITPLFIGPLADKLFNTEMLIAGLHLIGCVLLFMMAKANDARKFYWLTLLYALAFSPTLSLVNAIVFSHNEDLFGGVAGEGFPWIRVFGTIGWIVAGLSHTLLLKKGEPVNANPLLLASALSLILGIFAFTLPATPPKAAAQAALAPQSVTLVAAAQEPLAGASESLTADSQDGDSAASSAVESVEKAAVESVETLNGQPVAEVTNVVPVEESFIEGLWKIVQGSWKMLSDHPIFFLVTFVAAMAMGLYFAFGALFLEKTGVPPRIVGPVMTIGQWIEIIFMLTLPWFLGANNINMNWVLLAGICAWALRFGLFAIGKPLPMVLFGIAIHGICFDFFFAAGFINADMIAPESLTATAQTLYGFLVYGLGMYLGSELSGWLNQYFTKATVNADGEPDTVTNWRAFWAIPCVCITICAGLFLMTIFK